MKKLYVSLFFITSAIVATAQAPSIEWVKRFVSDSYSSPGFIELDAANHVYTTGNYHGTTDFDPGAGVFNMSSGIPSNMYISELDSAGNYIWAKNIGGSAFIVHPSGLKLDALGNIYIAGVFDDTTDFDPGPGIFNLYADSANLSSFILKLDAAGNFIWAKKIGGSGVSSALSTAFTSDVSADIYIAGSFSGTVDFDPGAATADYTSGTTADIFITRLDSAGNFIRTEIIGGSYPLWTGVPSLTTDAAGNLYTTGNYVGTVDFDPGVGVDTSTATTPYGNMFILKLDASGNFVWAKKIVGSSEVDSYSISLDGTGSVYTTGTFRDTVDFDPGTGVTDLTSNNSISSAFVLKLDGSGNFVWVRNIKGSYNTGSGATGFVIQVVPSGNIYYSGGYFGSVDFDSGPDSTIFALPVGDFEMFLSKLDPAGNFIWVKETKGIENHNFTTDMAINSFEEIYLTGYSSDSIQFEPGTGLFDFYSVAITAFIEKINEHTTGITEHKNSSDIFIYPNPATDLLTIDIDVAETTASVEIINVLGELVYSDVLKNTNGKQLKKIDVSALSKGVYFIQLKNKNSVSSKKFIKE